MDYNFAKAIKIEDYLMSLNIQPSRTRKSGSVLMYHSPIRNENSPSFEVNRPKNVWYDHGMGIGGNLIKLIMIMHNTNLMGSLEILDSCKLKFYTSWSRIHISRPRKNGGLKIINVRPIANPSLVSYIKERRISLPIAKKYLLEIIYKTYSHKLREHKIYSAIGFRNNNDGYELRNKYFKGCTTKDYTTIAGKSHDQLNIFEGFFDFLSAMEISKTLQLKYDSLVLNSVAMKEKTKGLIKNYSRINLFLDNDDAGMNAVGFYKDNHTKVLDYSKILMPDSVKDLNEYLVKRSNGDLN